MVLCRIAYPHADVTPSRSDSIVGSTAQTQTYCCSKQSSKFLHIIRQEISIEFKYFLSAKWLVG